MANQTGIGYPVSVYTGPGPNTSMIVSPPALKKPWSSFEEIQLYEPAFACLQDSPCSCGITTIHDKKGKVVGLFVPADCPDNHMRGHLGNDTPAGLEALREGAFDDLWVEFIEKPR